MAEGVIGITFRMTPPIRRLIETHEKWTTKMSSHDFIDASFWGTDLASDAADLMQESVVNEFETATFASGDAKAESTVYVPWHETEAFGDRPAAKPLKGTDTLAGAWRGGPGSVRRVTGKQIVIGAGRGRIGKKGIAYAEAYRGSRGGTYTGKKTFTVRPRAIGGQRTKKRLLGRITRRGKQLPKMFFALGLGMNVWHKPQRVRQGYVHHVRPHGYIHPDLRKKIEKKWLKHIFLDGPLATRNK